MNRGDATIPAIAILLALGLAGSGRAKEPDKTIEVTRKAGRLVFTEKGKTKPQSVTIVVGETIRWINRDDRPHTLRSVVEVDEKPLFDTGELGPGKHKDVLFNIDIYRKAGGRPANYVRLKYRSRDQAAPTAELIFLSAARR